MTDEQKLEIPPYLTKYYWWAYMHPWSAFIFDHQFAVNCILLGNYNRLRNAALEELSTNASGHTLQVGCCYGDLTPHLAARAAEGGGTLDVIDILPIQLETLRKKLPPGAPVCVAHMDAVALNFPNSSFDTVLMFLLLHEESPAYRESTMREALRVLKPDGKMVIVDYGRPARWHPARFSTIPLYSKLKPYAVDFWNNEVVDLLPNEIAGRSWRKTSYFGGLFQKLVSTK